MNLKLRENLKRCFKNIDDNTLYASYHDFEWGVESHDERYLFEMLILEGAQAGLSWEIVLKKREAYKLLFCNLEPQLVAKMTDIELEKLVNNPAIIRNKRKIFSVRQNAEIFLKIQASFKSFSKYIWSFVNNTQIINHWKDIKEVPSKTKISEIISKDLKERGMIFVGPTIIYSYMQAIGMVNDHLTFCFCHPQNSV
jgi:DNA-3-methyladenine glycosylase I